MSAFRIGNGSAHFKQQYVRTEKFTRERAAQRALLGSAVQSTVPLLSMLTKPVGKYRNPYADLIAFKIRSTANTNIVYFRGTLLACKEDSPPYAMDPNTLETLGLYDFDGQLPSCTFTAHPKLDPVTGEFVCFGYQAKGNGTPDVCYFVFDKQGLLTESVWMIPPVIAMIHDFAVTKNWVR